MRGWAILALIVMAAAPRAYCEPELSVEQHRVGELSFRSAVAYDDPFNTVTMDVVFTGPDHATMIVPAFWDGGDTWRVRFSFGKQGTYTCESVCSDASNTGLHGQRRTVKVVPYSGSNPLFAHGPAKVGEDKRHFVHADGTPFFWLGDTWWMGLCNRLHFPDEFKTLTDDRVAKGFTVVQIVAGLYPDMPPFDKRGANEAGFPWEDDYKRIRPEYFQAADKRLEALVDAGLTPCLVGAWGYFAPWMGEARLKQHWRYLVARYGALPIFWCIAGEANLPYYLTQGFPFDDRNQVKTWTAVAKYVKEIDPFHRPLTLHPTGLGKLSARGACDDVALLDFDMLQTGHGGREVIVPTMKTFDWSYGEQPTMPVLDGEVSYEMLMDRFTADPGRLAFWACMMSGAAGHTYGANGIWQLNRQDMPHGKSPHGGNYGTIPWDEAMKLPGSTQLANAKKLIEQYDWQHFEPHADWATLDLPPLVQFDGAEWIWFPEGNPAADSPAEKRFFRKAFELPSGAKVETAALRAAADDRFTAYLNGTELGTDDNWKTGKQFPNLAALLKEGMNVLAIKGENKAAPHPGNPAGLLCRLEIRLADGAAITITSDNTWRASQSASEGWAATDASDADWPNAAAIGKYGDGPWSRLDNPEEMERAYASGIPSKVRMIYVPLSVPVVVHALEPGAKYDATCFNAVTGETTKLETSKPDGTDLKVAPAPGMAQDWVLVLDPRP